MTVASQAPAPARRSALTVGEALRLSPLNQGRVVAGHPGLQTRTVRWVSVIEWPGVEDFVAPGELILTTGVSCDETRLEQLASQVAEAGAAALCVSLDPEGRLSELPGGVLALGDRLGFPIVDVPWAVRFADILRAIVDRLLSVRYAAAAPTGESMPSGLAAALLRRDGLTSVAEAAEEMLDRPVLVLDAAFAPLTSGRRARDRRGEVAVLADRAAALSADAARELIARFDGDDVVAVSDIAEVGLSSALVATAAAQGRVLGYVVALGDGRQSNALTVERHALQHAAVAAAIELLRQHAAAEAEARVHGDFIWELAGGVASRQELAARATLLGYSLHEQYGVALARGESEDSDAALDELVRQVRRRGFAEHVRASRRADHTLVLSPTSAPPLLQPARLARRLAEQLPRGSVSWGIADGCVELIDLAGAVQRARRALEVGRALRGPGVVADATELQPYLMLAGLAADPEARRVACALLEPLRRYDEGRSRELLNTLQVYLEENGNTSSAARRLYLNRHSLIYRLKKIEALTGRDLASHDDRFIFEASLRIHRLSAAADGPD